MEWPAHASPDASSAVVTGCLQILCLSRVPTVPRHVALGPLGKLLSEEPGEKEEE